MVALRKAPPRSAVAGRSAGRAARRREPADLVIRKAKEVGWWPASPRPPTPLWLRVGAVARRWRTRVGRSFAVRSRFRQRIIAVSPRHAPVRTIVTRGSIRSTSVVVHLNRVPVGARVNRQDRRLPPVRLQVIGQTKHSMGARTPVRRKVGGDNQQAIAVDRDAGLKVIWQAGGVSGLRQVRPCGSRATTTSERVAGSVAAVP